MTKRQTKIVEYLLVVLIIASLVALLGPPAVSDIEPMYRRRCRDHLRVLGIALQSYHEAYGSFPPAYLTDENGRPTHSWRVLLLPFLGLQATYDAYRFDEPWNGPNNAQLQENFLFELGRILSCPHSRQSASYLAVVGPHAAWAGSGNCNTTTDFPDGMAETVLLVEVTNSGISWFEPRDLEFDEMCFGINDPSHCGICSPHRTNTWWTYATKSMFAHVLYADGTVGELPDTTPPRIVRALLTRGGGEDVPHP